MPLISYFPSAGGGEEPGYSSWFGTGEDGDLTVTEDTPGTFATAFSTWALQAAQLIPVTLYCSIPFTSVSCM